MENEYVQLIQHALIELDKCHTDIRKYGPQGGVCSKCPCIICLEDVSKQELKFICRPCYELRIIELNEEVEEINIPIGDYESK